MRPHASLLRPITAMLLPLVLTLASASADVPCDACVHAAGDGSTRRDVSAAGALARLAAAPPPLARHTIGSFCLRVAPARRAASGRGG